ncbi:MAG: M48 family metalloprotease [Actinomycetota bacterium]|nr:M48 family metalloprotease [Actinomycetota bacterium]
MRLVIGTCRAGLKPRWDTGHVLDHGGENRRRATTLLGACVAAIVAVVWLMFAVTGHPVLGLLVGAVVAATVVSVGVRRSLPTALAKAGATPADPKDEARFHNLVEGLSAAAGVPKPDLYVIEDPAMNAFAAGRDPRHAALVCTRGLLDGLTRIELEGIVAHELSHIRHLDILPSTLAVTLVATLAPSLVTKVVGARRESLADVTGVSLTRYPPGLISALEKLRDDTTGLQISDRAIAHLWIEAPAEQTDHPPLDERIQALREL